MLGWITDHEGIEITRDLLKTKETGMVDDDFYVPSFLDYINRPARTDLLHLAEEKKRLEMAHQRAIAKHHLEKKARMESQGKE